MTEREHCDEAAHGYFHRSPSGAWTTASERSVADLIQRERADLLARAEAAEAERDVALAACERKEERNERWQEATGLLVGGDPGGVDPEHLADEMKLHSEMFRRVRDAWAAMQVGLDADNSTATFVRGEMNMRDVVAEIEKVLAERLPPDHPPTPAAPARHLPIDDTGEYGCVAWCPACRDIRHAREAVAR